MRQALNPGFDHHSRWPQRRGWGRHFLALEAIVRHMEGWPKVIRVARSNLRRVLGVGIVLAGLLLIPFFTPPMVSLFPFVGGDACASGPARPLSPSVVAGALRAEGVTVYPRSDPSCTPRTVMELSNLLISAGGSGVVSPDEVAAQDGHILCSVYDRPASSSEQLRTVQTRTSRGGVQFLLANADCVIYPKGSNAAGQVRPVERAFEALEMSLSR
jgi:hypothetical protein